MGYNVYRHTVMLVMHRTCTVPWPTVAESNTPLRIAVVRSSTVHLINVPSQCRLVRCM